MTRKIESEYNSPDNSCQSSGADLHTPLSPSDEKIGTRDAKLESEEVKESDSKSSVSSFSLEEARRSMENSIAMLSKVRPEANTVDQLCAKTETVSMSDVNERERKLKNAREIISNAIPIGRLRKPPMPFGANGRSATGGINLTGSQSTKQFRFGPDTPEPKFDTMSVPRSKYRRGLFNSKIRFTHGCSIFAEVSVGSISTPQGDETKTSHAEITLKSATLPRRKIGKVDVHGESQTKVIYRIIQHILLFINHPSFSIRPNRRHQQHSRRRCDSLPRCNIKCQTFAVHRFESIPSRSPYINVPTALSHRSRNTPSPFRSHPPTSGQHRMHLVRRREAPFPVSLPTSQTIRTLQRLKAKFRLFQAVLRAAAPPCPSRRAHVSS